MKRDSVFRQIRRDWRACFERDPAARNWAEVLLAYPGFHAIFWHRLVIHPLNRLGFPVVPRVLSNLSRFFTGIEIHPGAEIGSGLFIDHGTGVVIGETSEIGADCTLYQGVTLGGTSLQHGKRHPTLEDGVIVGAGAAILGAIVIGARSKVAAGSVVVKSVPPDCTVVGVPGRVIYQDGKPAEPVLPRVDLPDPEGDAIAGLSARVEALENVVRKLEEPDGSKTLQ
ncbi:MAG: serine O-acetyltransferase [Candidatus Eremiobacteraeota bacterium]|nr:serine O-acetyltransferase [Candidatus Eremiobacteraeota bacterium]MBV8223038.1 serine O-acetyltransferase [Candidatus Eremiobacteraeota bacterium]MBV8282993.1 serine O-acetyltransferase [Candidatus Eremiobacteraeota bacterium]